MLEAIRSKTSVKNGLSKAEKWLTSGRNQIYFIIFIFLYKKTSFFIRKKTFHAAFALYDSVYDANAPGVRQTLKNRRIHRKLAACYVVFVRTCRNASTNILLF
ncbi:hypothetical protein BHT95_08675 [Bacillus paralicheniformis]|nr:hypothetical protein BHT95_08675 [Bacillus paralicheniformis]TWM54181.1 hypothetical protein CHCC14814_2989 [Bacillus paralicheniformis]